jgi:hypothetical protein
MAQRLKRWESPRREGRNDKGRGGSARQRQKRKQFKLLRQKLKDQSGQSDSSPESATDKFKQGRSPAFPIFLPTFQSGSRKHLVAA